MLRTVEYDSCAPSLQCTTHLYGKVYLCLESSWNFYVRLHYSSISSLESSLTSVMVDASSLHFLHLLLVLRKLPPSVFYCRIRFRHPISSEHHSSSFASSCTRAFDCLSTLALPFHQVSRKFPYFCSA